MKSEKPSGCQTPGRVSRRLLALVLLGILSMGSGTVRAGTNVWTSIGPEGGAIRALAIDPQNPNTIYAVPNTVPSGTVFKSTDGGSTWAKTVQFPCCSAVTVVNVLAIDPQNPRTVYAGTQHGGIFKTTDGAATWSAINSGLPPLPSALSNGANFPIEPIEALAIDPRNSNTVYAGIAAEPFGVYKSTNGGASWTVASAGLPDQHNIISLAIDPLNPSTLYAGSDGTGLFKSSDGGATWIAANSGMRPFSSDRPLLIDPKGPTTLYTWNGDGLFKSTDGGASWSTVNGGLTNLDIQSLAIDPQNPSTVYAGTFGGGAFAITFAP